MAAFCFLNTPMINWERLVVAPCVNVFGQPAVLNALVSAPGTPPVTFSAIWTNASIEIAEPEGTYRTENQPQLGCGISQFTILPQQNDQIITNNVTYDVVDVVQDGQGGVTFMLRRTSGITATVQADPALTEQCAPGCICRRCRNARR